MHVVWVPCYVPVFYPSPYRINHCVHPYQRLYPEVNEGVFVQSASSMMGVMEDARTVVEQISNSKDFANEVMGAAQESDQSKVDTLIRSTGVTSSFQAEYNPDRLKLNMSSSAGEVECCKLTVILRWRL
ncbi:hypothetical protein SAMN04487936_105330 [Halobacillus dabanensis]|uniref:Uncharacterized protein n=1 Tax=Halobacillus dabanensis TaxID=240302 RepID=A0A1I3VI93_HALDA|nr:hypothetical protein [Halobacillus dabanensis]SFJ94723.1 hypothetical protein SAMN04487936_105330 [Halobacillus dabanensis]